MAEAIAISLSSKLAVTLSRSAALGISRLVGVRSDITAAKGELDLLRSFLRFADSRRGSATGTEDDHVAEWVKQVREAAFELEDVADECSYLSVHQRFAAKDLVNIKAWVAVSRRLRRARERLSQLMAAREQYGIRYPDDPAPAPAPYPVTLVSGAAAAAALAVPAGFLEKEEIVGFAAHEKQLLEWVVRDDAAEPRCRTRTPTLVAVCGMGGVGKTTLVRRVYREVAAMSHFECAAWVAVSRGVTRDDLLRKILKELHLHCDDGGGRGGAGAGADYLHSFVAAVRSHLANRRYLIVLDDVWDAHLWGMLLRHAFPDDGATGGSRVIITTRSRDVAMAAVPERIMTLQPLSGREAWTLFCNVAFGGSREASGSGSGTDDSWSWTTTCPRHLKQLADSFLRRCGGLPLAIVSIANLLALKERTEFAWRNVHDRLVWDKSSSDLEIGEAASILNLSIDDLPHHLKGCFLSCSIYSEDFLIKRKILIRNWVAQGFIQEEQQHGSAATRTVEDVADDYLDQLVHRSLIQAVEVNEFGRVKRILIHDLFRDLISHRSREEGFFQFTNCRITMDRRVRIRHLSVDRCEMGCESIPRQGQASIRSFHAFGSEFDALFLSRFRLITVLNLWFVEMNKLPSTVTSLHNLRYLGIRSTLIEELPEDLGNLQKLQTLDAKLSMVQRLPASTAKLKSLRHLILLRRRAADILVAFPAMDVGAPKGLENLTSLQTLKYVVADKKMVASLERLEQIRSLELSGVDASLTPDLSSSISRMSCLVCLGLIALPSADDAVLDLESITRPPRKLQKLSLTGKLARGRLPSWTTSLTSLVLLRLCRCAIAQDSISLLAELPGLVSLSLIAAYRDKVITFAGGSFPALKRLTLHHLANLTRIEFRQGCLVSLRDLVLRECTKLTDTPQGMENLKNPLNLEFYGMPIEFQDKLMEHKHDAESITDSEIEAREWLPSRYTRWMRRNK